MNFALDAAMFHDLDTNSINVANEYGMFIAIAISQIFFLLRMLLPERIYNLHYSNGVPAVFVLSS